jgi:hypothetical protein
MGQLHITLTIEQTRRLGRDRVLVLDPGEADTTYGPIGVTIETADIGAACEECGLAIVPDVSPGVWVHDPGDLAERAYELDEAHTARPPEGTAHPAEQPQPEPLLAIHYSGPPFALDQSALIAWLKASSVEPPDPDAANSAVELFDAALAQKAIIVPQGLSAEMYGDDVLGADGVIALVVYATAAAAPGERPRGVTRGWHDVALLTPTSAPESEEARTSAVRDALQAIVDELNSSLQTGVA